jgi:hypothetical protein
MAKTKQASKAVNKMEPKPRKVRLTLSDGETGESRFCTLDEAKTWDWKNPEVWRMVGHLQIASYESLIEVLSMKIENGAKEIEIVVSPRFMSA